MKNISRLLTIVTAFFCLPSMAQHAKNIDFFVSAYKQNHLLNKQNELNNQLYAQKEEALVKSLYPMISMDAKTTYVSEVIDIDFPLPGAPDVPSPPNWQFDSYLNIVQPVYSGGRIKASLQANEAERQFKLLQAETDIYGGMHSVFDLAFSYLLAEKNMQNLQESLALLDKRIEALEVSVNQGMAIQAELDNLKSAKLELLQRQVELQSAMQSQLISLNILCGLNDSVQFVPQNEYDSLRFQRIEYEVFAQNKHWLDERIALMKAEYRPQVGIFGRAGYGKPGLNMLSEDFNDYYVAGIQLQWKIFDWNTLNNKKQEIAIQQEMVENHQAIFNQGIDVQTSQLAEQLKKYSSLIEMDSAIIELKESVVRSNEWQLDKGMITTVTYLDALTAYTSAKNQLSRHMVEKEKAIVLYHYTAGKTIDNQLE